MAMRSSPIPGLLLLLSAPASAAGGGGPDFVALGLHAFNLALLFVVIAVLAGGKIRGAVASRSAEIKAEIDESNRLRKEAQERSAELQARLDGFEQRLAELKAEAEVEAEVERQAILRRAQAEAERIQEAAERTIRGEVAKARMALRAEAVELSMALAEERLSSTVGANDDARLADGFFQEVARG